MTTVALLPTPGDPFLARYWVRNYERVWKGEVDRLLVFVNGHNPEEAAEIFYAAGADVFTESQRVGHGDALRFLLGHATEDTVVLMEDDAWVRTPGVIREHLRRAQEGEIIGSPRGGMSPVLEVAANDKWGDIVGPDGSHGAGLWPCFLFTRREFLTDTDMTFSSRFWGSGEVVPGLNYSVGSDALDTDTFTAIAFQLRAKHSITLAGQWKEVHLKESMPADAPWFHAGGLSTFDEPIPPGLSGSNAGRDFAHRLYWWDRTASVEFAALTLGVRERIGRVQAQTERAGLVADVNAWRAIAKPWVTWQDYP